MFFVLAFLLVASASASQSRTSDTSCTLCKFVIKSVEDFITSEKTEAEIVDWLKNSVCTLLPSPYSELCAQEVAQYGPQLIEWIISKATPEVVCARLSLCTANQKVVQRFIEANKVRQTSCSICQLVVTFAENYLQNNGTIAGLEAALEQVCAVLPSPYNDQCVAFVDAQLPALIKWLVDNNPPQQFCAQLGLCSAKKVDLLPKPQQTSCSICQFVVTFVENYLRSNGTIDQLEKALEEACSILPSPYSDQCVAFVDAQLPALVQWIIDNNPPQQFCAEIGLCSAKAIKLQQTSCSICQLVVTLAENYLQSDGAIEELEAVLEQACDLLPSPYSGQCVAFVDAQLPALIKWLVENNPPQQFCAQLGLCSAKKADLLPKPQQTLCSVCQMVVTIAENYLQSDGAIEELEAVLDQACDLLPSPYNDQCVAFVDAQLPALIKWLVENNPPEQFCAHVGLCSSRLNVLKPKKL